MQNLEIWSGLVKKNYTVVCWIRFGLIDCCIKLLVKLVFQMLNWMVELFVVSM